MSDSPYKYDENDPTVKARLKYLEELNRRTVDNISCWQDFYDQVKLMSHTYSSDPTRNLANYTIAVLSSFVIALEQLPEEGDIKVIVARLNEILVMQPDITGIYLDVDGSKASIGALQYLAEVGKSLNTTDPTQETPPAKGYIH